MPRDVGRSSLLAYALAYFYLSLHTSHDSTHTHTHTAGYTAVLLTLFSIYRLYSIQPISNARLLPCEHKSI